MEMKNIRNLFFVAAFCLLASLCLTSCKISRKQVAEYGITSNDIYERLIPQDATDEELDGPAFEVRWKSWKAIGH